MAAHPIDYAESCRRVAVVKKAIADGFPFMPAPGSNRSAIARAAEELKLSIPTLRSWVIRLRWERPQLYAELVSPGKVDAPFDPIDLPSPEMDARQLIALQRERYERRRSAAEARSLIPVRVRDSGPVGVAFFGDPHIDDDGCAIADLERDVALCQTTPGVMAVAVGDFRNNWVGRLQRLWAEQSHTRSESVILTEWLFRSLPWLVLQGGNHDSWNTDGGDVLDIIARDIPGVYGGGSNRLELKLPAGASVRMHIRHDFPGQSQFNPAHALVRQTLFDYRDHILACGHRHQSGYQPIWHNDPEPRLCHAIRVASYKDDDHYAAEKGFKYEQWARSMLAVIDPDNAGSPSRFIHVFYDLGEGCEFLTWKRRRFGRTQTGEVTARPRKPSSSAAATRSAKAGSSRRPPAKPSGGAKSRSAIRPRKSG